MKVAELFESAYEGKKMKILTPMYVISPDEVIAAAKAKVGYNIEKFSQEKHGVLYGPIARSFEKAVDRKAAKYIYHKKGDVLTLYDYDDTSVEDSDGATWDIKQIKDMVKKGAVLLEGSSFNSSKSKAPKLLTQETMARVWKAIVDDIKDEGFTVAGNAAHMAEYAQEYAESAFKQLGIDGGQPEWFEMADYIQRRLQKSYNAPSKRHHYLESHKPGLFETESSGLSQKKKSAVVKKAKKGGDIGKSGKKFADVAASAAKRYGSKEAGEKVAAAAMWKNIKR